MQRAVSTLTVLLVTHLPVWPVGLVLLSTAAFMTMKSMRYVPAMVWSPPASCRDSAAGS